MTRVFLVHHMKRSGGHAVIRWLMSHLPNAAFVNDAIPIEKVITGRRSIPDGFTPYADWLRRVRPADLADALTVADSVMVSLEDHELQVRPFHHAAAESVIILRHPRNLFASRIKRAQRTGLSAYRLANPQTLARAVRIWKEHARAALTSSREGGPQKTVFYDAWLIGEDYRARLASDFGFAAPRDLSMRVELAGGGSSFGDTEVRPGDLLRRADFLSGGDADLLAWIMSDAELADLADQVSTEVTQLTSATG